MIWPMEISKILIEEQLLDDKVLRDKEFNIAKNSNYGRYQYEWLIIFLIKKISSGTVKNENISNKKFAEKLHKPIVRKFNKRKVHLPFTDNIWGADLADM